MLSFKAIIQKSKSGDQQMGWTYVVIPQDLIPRLKLKNRKEFRIKGIMDDMKFERLACYPVKEGSFIIVLNAQLRKKLGKKEGAMLSVKFEKDNSGALKSQELLDCLKEDEAAQKQFDTLTMAAQNYFHNYINSAKGAATKAGRIVNTINAMHKKQDFGAMIRSLKQS
jgi:hypothetical protein